MATKFILEGPSGEESHRCPMCRCRPAIAIMPDGSGKLWCPNCDEPPTPDAKAGNHS